MGQSANLHAGGDAAAGSNVPDPHLITLQKAMQALQTEFEVHAQREELRTRRVEDLLQLQLQPRTCDDTSAILSNLANISKQQEALIHRQVAQEERLSAALISAAKHRESESQFG